jgi:hypothetical protein
LDEGKQAKVAGRLGVSIYFDPGPFSHDVNELLARGVLRKSDAGGRSTSYEQNDFH